MLLIFDSVSFLDSEKESYENKEDYKDFFKELKNKEIPLIIISTKATV